jgi:hypothetical protein
MDHSSVLQTHRLPASLRHVHGFPMRRLLRKLRPRRRPSPVVAASPVRTGQASRVPVFRSSTLVPLGGELCPLRLGMWAMESRSHLECGIRTHQRGTSSRAGSVRITLSPTPSRDSETFSDIEASDAHFVISPWTLR